MRDITERIDELCEQMYGHTHWVCVDTLRDQEKVGLDQVADIVTIEGQQVALYHTDVLDLPLPAEIKAYAWLPLTVIPVREALKDASISIATAQDDMLDGVLQMSDLEHIQDKITELENLLDPVPFTNGRNQGVTS